MNIGELDDLADDVLVHILSFLSTKEAVRTSVISKRWRNLWRYSSRVALDQNDFNCLEEFSGFGDMVLCHRKTTYLHTFSMRCYDEFGREPYSDICKRWINSAIKFKPRVCHIEASVPDRDSIACAFACESIEDMSLEIYVPRSAMSSPYIIPTTVNLQYIKRLSLTNAYINGKIATRLLKGCPVLESLELKSCSGVFSPIFRQKLICLSLIDCKSENYDLLILSKTLPKTVDLPCIRKLHIRTISVDKQNFARLLTGCPLLENLSLENCCGELSKPFRHNIKSSKWDCTSKTLWLNNSSLWDCTTETWHKFLWHINRAIVKFNLSGDAEALINCTLQPLQLIFIWNPLIGAALDLKNDFDSSIFSNAECLNLSFPDTKVEWMIVLSKINTFNNLKSLSLRLADWCMQPKEIDPVVWFLHKSPNIEKLTLYNPKREIEVNKRGKPKPLVLCHEIAYYTSLSLELLDFENIKQFEIKVCKNLFGADSLKQALLRQIEDLLTVKVVLSEYDDE